MLIDVYTHFAKRLRQRYKIEITFAQYMRLKYEPFYTIEKLQKGRSICCIKIKNKFVIVVKERKSILTCLPKKDFEGLY